MKEATSFVGEVSDIVSRRISHGFDVSGERTTYIGLVQRAFRAQPKTSLIYEIQYDGF